MRVALVHPFSWPHVRRGGERYLHDLAWYLSAHGHEVDVVVGGAPGVETTAEGRLVRLRHPRRLQVRKLTELETFGLPALGWLARHRYDVVHALTPTAALAATVVRSPVAYTALGHPTAATLGARPVAARTFRTAMRHVDAPLALSASAATHIEDVTGVRPQVLPPGVRVPEFPLRDEPRTGPPQVMFPAFASDRRKCLDVLVSAFGRVLDRRPDARLVLAGGGDAEWAFASVPDDVRARVRAATTDLGAGELGDVPARYAAATVTVLPSVDEAFGLVLVESMAAGTPVVGVASGGPTEIVTDDGIGRLAAPRDPADLADAIDATIDVAADPTTPQRCAQHALAWDWEATIGPRHVEVYRAIARGGSGRG